MKNSVAYRNILQKHNNLALKKKHLVFGRHPVLEALQEGQSFEKIFLSSGAKGAEASKVEKIGREQDIPVQRVPVQKLNKLCTANHQGMLGILSQIKYYQIQDILDQAYSEGRDPLFIVLDHVSDVGNFGAIARTAKCCGVDAIVTPLKGGALITGDAIKASAGALNTLPVCRARFLDEAIALLKLNGLQIIAADIKGNKNLHELDMKIPLAIVLGSEDKGLSRKVEEAADHLFKIPMQSDFDSLNVSVSAGMILYELMRQRLLA
ncbi:MAG: 23S rRNA (guanosine(2251)-2'-O)-methyltransferase RlmB [Chitinophagales bacterium]